MSLFMRVALCAALTATTAWSFVVPGCYFGGRTTNNNNQHHNTRLFISSWGTKGPPHRWASETQNKKKDNPETNIQSYLDAPQAVEARNTIDGTALVSGLVRSKERTDQFMFDMLHHEESAFQFSKIIAFVDDVAFCKKRLLSRSARYTGLLDKLEFVQANSPRALPTTEQLENVKTWVAVLDPEDDDDDGEWLFQSVSDIASLAKQVPSIKNVAILMASALELDANRSAEILQMLEDDSFAYTLVAVGKLSDDTPEGQAPYQYREFGTVEGVLPSNATFSRDESSRLIAELLQLECGANRALTFSEVSETNQTEAKLIRGLRQAGYARLQEIEHMISKGPEAYQQAIEDFKKENPDSALGYTTDAWWEEERFSRGRKALTYDDDKSTDGEIKDERTKEIENIAKEWAKREFFRQNMAGTLREDITEKEYVERVWERALLEADVKYKQIRGQDASDGQAKLADFRARQERKQETMLKRAKEELASMLDEENLGGEDIAKRLEEREEDDDKKKMY